MRVTVQKYDYYCAWLERGVVTAQQWLWLSIIMMARLPPQVDGIVTGYKRRGILQRSIMILNKFIIPLKRFTAKNPIESAQLSVRK